jgi:hypothetical protein
MRKQLPYSLATRLLGVCLLVSAAYLAACSTPPAEEAKFVPEVTPLPAEIDKYEAMAFRRKSADT